MRDETLVRRFLAGDRAAWEELIERYRPSFWKVIVGMTNCDAEILKRLSGHSPLLIQEAFVDEAAQALKDMRPLPDDFDFAIWLYRFVLKRAKKGPWPLPPTGALDFEGLLVEAFVQLGERYPHYQEAVVMKDFGRRWSDTQGDLTP